MAVILGKRKRLAEQKVAKTKSKQHSPEAESSDEDNARALFQRAFEAKFKPLEQSKRTIAEDVREDECGGSTECNCRLRVSRC